MGLILLIGLIVKNGIILIDYADRARRARRRVGRMRWCSAGAVRLRPILMTTLCTLFGLLPLALGLGRGGGAAEAAGDCRHWRADRVDDRDAAVRPHGAVADQRWNSDVSARIGGREAPGLSSVWTE